MRVEDFEWHAGNVEYWDLDSVDLDLPMSEQLDELKEDLAQVAYPGGRLLDIGWFGRSSGDPRFLLRVVQDGDWDQPVFIEEHRSVASLASAIPRAVGCAGASRT